MTVGAPRIPDPGHEPSNHGSSASRPGPRYGRSHRSVDTNTIALRVSGGRSPRFGPNSGRAQADAPPSAADAGVRVRRRDAAAVEVVADHPRGRHEVPVAGDRRREPVDVGRLEGRDLAQRVPVELPERQLDVDGLVERRAGRRAEVAEPRPGQAGRSACSPAVARARPGRPWRGLAGERMGRGEPALGGPERDVPRPERVRRVDPARHRAGRTRPRRAATAGARAVRAAGRSLAGAVRVRVADPPSAAGPRRLPASAPRRPR